MLSNRSLLIQWSIFRCQFAFQLPSKLHGINANPPWLVTKDFSSFPVGNSRNVKTSGIRWGLKEFLGRISYDIQKKLHLCLEISLHQITWHEWVLDQDRQNQLLVTLSFAYDKSALRCIRSLAENSKKEAQQESPLNTWNAKIWGRQISPGSKVRES